jgi:heme exporter protein A
LRIAVENLACRRSGRLVFSGLSFALSAGQALVVTGWNGAGKSTLLALLAGRLQPESGTIRADDIGEASLPERLHWVGHRDALKAALTAEENLAFARDLLGDPALSPRDALDAVGLAHAAPLPVAYLSAGQRRRVALARLLVAHRPLWLLDEPTSALDTASQATLLHLMTRHLAGGGLIVAATHQALGIEGAQEVRIERALNPSPLEGEGGPRISEGRERGRLGQDREPSPAASSSRDEPGPGSSGTVAFASPSPDPASQSHPLPPGEREG